MMNVVASLLAAALIAATGCASANESGVRLDPAPVRRLDVDSLQRGARNFVNYCLNVVRHASARPVGGSPGARRGLAV